jgi:hypothetical protein
MAVNHIEIGGALPKLIEKDCAGAYRVSMRPAQPQRTRDDWYKFSSRDGVAASKQGHIVTKVNQFLGEP